MSSGQQMPVNVSSGPASGFTFETQASGCAMEFHFCLSKKKVKDSMLK